MDILSFFTAKFLTAKFAKFFLRCFEHSLSSQSFKSFAKHCQRFQPLEHNILLGVYLQYISKMRIQNAYSKYVSHG